MASNAIPENPDVVVALAEDIEDGLDTYEVVLEIKINTKTHVEADNTAFLTAEDNFAKVKTLRANRATQLSLKDKAVTEWLTNAAKLLRISLGESWNAKWEPTHFPNNKTQVPTTQEKRFTLIGRLATYFAAHPQHESANHGVTAAAAAALSQQVSQCRDDLNQAETDQKAAKIVRDDALKALRKRLGNFVKELGMRLGPDDPRWEAFGLSRPSDPDTPLPASALTVQPKGAGSLLYKWKRGRRATYYRLFIKVTGVDTDFRQVEPNTEGLSYLVEDLPSGATVEAYLIAANESGEAEATATVSGTVG